MSLIQFCSAEAGIEKARHAQWKYHWALIVPAILWAVWMQRRCYIIDAGHGEEAANNRFWGGLGMKPFHFSIISLTARRYECEPLKINRSRAAAKFHSISHIIYTEDAPSSGIPVWFSSMPACRPPNNSIYEIADHDLWQSIEGLMCYNFIMRATEVASDHLSAYRHMYVISKAARL